MEDVQLDFAKMNGLIPAVIQDNTTLKVLMLGFMNEEALAKTEETGKVTFFSRTKNTPSLGAIRRGLQQRIPGAGRRIEQDSIPRTA